MSDNDTTISDICADRNRVLYRTSLKRVVACIAVLRRGACNAIWDHNMISTVIILSMRMATPKSIRLMIDDPSLTRTNLNLCCDGRLKLNVNLKCLPLLQVAINHCIHTYLLSLCYRLNVAHYDFFFFLRQKVGILAISERKW